MVGGDGLEGLGGDDDADPEDDGDAGLNGDEATDEADGSGEADGGDDETVQSGVSGSCTELFPTGVADVDGGGETTAKE